MNTYSTRRQACKRHPTSRRKGGTIVLFVFSVIGLLGVCALGVDYGVMVVDANQLQRSTDAAALAGAFDLPDTTKAQATAERVLRQNFKSTVPKRIATDPDPIFNFTHDNTQIQVTSTTNQPFMFGLIFRLVSTDSASSASLTRHSTARVAGRGGSTMQIAPIGISSSMYDANRTNYTQDFDVKLINHKVEDFTTDSMMLFDVRSVSSDAKSPVHMKAQLTGDEQVSLNTTIGVDGIYEEVDALNADTKPSNENFIDGMATLFMRSSNTPWSDNWTGDVFTSVGIRYNEIINGSHPPNNPRLRWLIVTPDAPSTTGNTASPIVHFVPVYMESIYLENNNVKSPLHLTYRFVPESAVLPINNLVSLVDDI